MKNKKLKNIIDIRDGTHESPKYLDHSDYFFITSKNLNDNSIDFESARYISEIDYLSYIKRSYCNVGDIIFPLIGTIGKNIVIITDSHLKNKFAVKNVGIIKPIKKHVNNRFLFYWFKSECFYKQIRSSERSGVVSFLGLNMLRNMKIMLPVISQQEKIVSFLDNSCSKIDKEIALLEKKSILLDEYKNSLIYETVTKGLDKNAKMKDSGVEWIGEIPNHWKIKRIKEIANVEKGKSNEMFDFDEKNIDLFPCIDTNFLRNRKNSIMYNASGRLTDKGDVLILWDGANAGELFVNTQKGYLGSTFGRFNNKKSVNSNFLFYYLKGIEKHFRNNLVGMGIPHVNTTKLKTTAFFHPPYGEQLEIVDFLNVQNEQIEKKIELINKKVELLKEYKQSLIYEAMTGQLEIK